MQPWGGAGSIDLRMTQRVGQAASLPRVWRGERARGDLGRSLAGCATRAPAFA